MHIERPHNTTQQKAVQLIDTFLVQLQKQQLPGGVAISGQQKKWNGSRMEFSFRAGAGFLSASISGTIDVTERTVVLDSQLPGTVTSSVGEEKIRTLIEQQLDVLFKK